MIAWGGIFASKYMNMYRRRFFETCLDLHVFPPTQFPFIFMQIQNVSGAALKKKKTPKKRWRFFPTFETHLSIVKTCDVPRRIGMASEAAPKCLLKGGTGWPS